MAPGTPTLIPDTGFAGDGLRLSQGAGGLDAPQRARRRVDLPLLTIAFAAAVAATTYAGLGLQVHRALHTTAFDLAFFDQILWNTAHGRLFQTTYVAYNFLGQHFELVLLPLAALYRLGVGPQTLIAVQATTACGAAVPLFLAGRRLAGSGPGLALAAAYLVSTPLQRGLDFGFHPDLFEPLFAFSALALLLAGHRRAAIVLLALLLVTKEDAFLLVALIGWVCALTRDRRFGVLILLAAVAWGVLVLGVLMPHLRHGVPSDLVERYGYLGSAPASIVGGALTHPDRVLAHLARPGPAGAVLLLLLTTGLLPLIAPEILVAAVPVALVGLLATHPAQATLDLQYGTPVLVAFFIAALCGLARLRCWAARAHGWSAPRWFRERPTATLAVAAGLCAFAGSVAGALALGPFPGEGRYQAWRFHDGGEAAALKSVLPLIPADAPLSAQTGLAPHLSQRRDQWEFPRIVTAQYVVLEEGGMVSGQGRDEYGAKVAELPALGFVEIAHAGSIRVFRLNGLAGQPS
ncbi:MAG: DUF2079 domain-containing protein [Dehalococcoidia bacterium]